MTMSRDMAVSSISPYPDFKVLLPHLSPSIPWQPAALTKLPHAWQDGSAKCCSCQKVVK